MHSYHNKLLPNHFDDYFLPVRLIQYHYTRLFTYNNTFLPRVTVTHLQENLSHFWPKSVVQITR